MSQLNVCHNPACLTEIPEGATKCAWCGYPAGKVPTNEEYFRLVREGGTELQQRRKREGYAVKP